MPIIKNASIRHRIIDEMLRNPYRLFPSMEELRVACEERLYGSEWGEHISISTIEKDLKYLREEKDAPIKYNKQKEGYFYEDAGFSLEKIPLTEEEKSALKFAAATLDQYAHVGIFKMFKDAIRKIFAQTSIGVEETDTAFIHFETSPEYTGSEWMSMISGAVMACEMLKISYFSFNTNQLKSLRFCPYVLKEYRGLWYVLGMEKKREKLITLELSRIQHIEITTESFQIEHFSPIDYFKYSPGISVVDTPVQEVELWISGSAWRYIERIPIHPLQEIKGEHEAGLLLSFKSYIAEELIQQILSYGETVKVLQPESLKEEVKNRISNVAKLYL